MIAIYARQSTNKTNSVSVDSQIELCLRECEGEYTPFIDREISNKKSDRPAYKQLLKAVERGEINRVVVYCLDTIVRSLTEFGHLWETLSANNTEFTSVTEKFNTATPSGREINSVIMNFAKIERDTIAQRIRDNYRERAKRGIYPGGPAPYGFDIGHTIIDGKSVSILVPNSKISVVKEIFELYAGGGISLGKLALHLHDEGISGINRTGWDNVSISRILHNPVYVKADAKVYSYFKEKGVVIYNDIEQFAGKKGCWLLGKRAQAQGSTSGAGELLVAACHDGVVDADIYLICQQRLDANKRLKNTGNGAYTWLSGLVKCGYCGYSMQAVSANAGRYVYLICTGKTNFKVCDAKFRSPHVDAIEPIVADKISEKLKELKGITIKEKHDGIELEDMKKELSVIEGKISRLVDGLADSNDVAASYINRRITELDANKSALVENIKKLLERRRSIEFPDCEFSSLSFEQKKALAKALIQKVCLTNGKPEIEWAKI